MEYPDKTQQLLNRMATVQIEASIRQYIEDGFAHAKAAAMNAAKVTPRQYRRSQLLGEPAYCAIIAHNGSPPARVILH